LDPLAKKLHADTWHYVKRCLLALAENVSKQLVHLKDTTAEEILTFLDKTIALGVNIIASSAQDISILDTASTSTPQSVTFEARQLKAVFLALSD